MLLLGAAHFCKLMQYRRNEKHTEGFGSSHCSVGTRWSSFRKPRAFFSTCLCNCFIPSSKPFSVDPGGQHSTCLSANRFHSSSWLPATPARGLRGLNLGYKPPAPLTRTSSSALQSPKCGCLYYVLRRGRKMVFSCTTFKMYFTYPCLLLE